MMQGTTRIRRWMGPMRPATHERGGMTAARKVLLIAFAVVLLGVPNLSPANVAGDSRHTDEGPVPQSMKYPYWADSFDDLSRVYNLPSGLVGVEVVGGEVRLKTGSSDGWIASSIIMCPNGFRYDFARIDAVTPGGSRVEVSILNASKESKVVGFANETLPGFMLLNTKEPRLDTIDAEYYPEIRVQVDLHASGADRPRLHGWAVNFVAEGEWRDDFVTAGKIGDMGGINVSHGSAGLNLSQVSSGPGRYSSFPPVVFSMYDGGTSLDIFYPDASHTRYQDVTEVDAHGTSGTAFDDLNGDGYLDLVCANYQFSSSQVDSEVWWGTSSGTWSSSGATSLSVNYAVKASTGDFNGDGERDVVFACMGNNPDGAPVFLNQGRGTFNYAADIKLPTTQEKRAGVGDLNGDGYDDIVFADYSSGLCYFGGPDGPDTSVDITLGIGLNYNDVLVEDLDADGYQDVLFATSYSRSALLYMGDPDGPDTTADYIFYHGSEYCLACAAGDLNGDGWTDLVLAPYNLPMRIYKG